MNRRGFLQRFSAIVLGTIATVYCPSVSEASTANLELKDKTDYHQKLMQLHDKEVISTRTLLEEMGLNYDQEVKRMRYEQSFRSI